MTTFLLPTEPITSLVAYLATDTGGQGIRRARDLGAAATIDEVLAVWVCVCPWGLVVVTVLVTVLPSRLTSTSRVLVWPFGPVKLPWRV